MKKLVVTALILCAGVFLQPADAAMIILDYQGDTIATSNNIERTLLINAHYEFRRLGKNSFGVLLHQ